MNLQCNKWEKNAIKDYVVYYSFLHSSSSSKKGNCVDDISWWRSIMPLDIAKFFFNRSKAIQKPKHTKLESVVLHGQTSMYKKKGGNES